MDGSGERRQQAAAVGHIPPWPGIDGSDAEAAPPSVDLRDVHEAAVDDQVDIVIEGDGLRRRRRGAGKEQDRGQDRRAEPRDIALNSTHAEASPMQAGGALAAVRPKTHAAPRSWQ